MRQDVEDLCKKLEPIKPKLVKKLWRQYSTSGRTLRDIAERQIRQSYDDTFGPAFRATTEALLPPPSPGQAAGPYKIGNVLYAERQMGTFGLLDSELPQHVAIFGRSGSGKTNLAYVLIQNFLRLKKPFLVLDWKKAYRNLQNLPEGKTVQVFDPNNFRFNPFIPPPGTSPKVWARRLIEVACHAYFAGAGVSDVLIHATSEAYKNNPTPTPDLILHFTEKGQEKSRQALWKSSALRIMRAMTYGQLKTITNTSNNNQLPKLLKSHAILELDTLGSADKTFLIEAVLLWIHTYRLNQERIRGNFLHAIIIEEAHHVLLRKKQELSGDEGVTDIILREIRELGEAVILIDQHPSLVSLPALGNTYTTICFNLKTKQDIEAASKCLLLNREEEPVLGMLDIGKAVVKIQGRYQRPFLIQVPLLNLPTKPKDNQYESIFRDTVSRNTSEWLQVNPERFRTPEEQAHLDNARGVIERLAQQVETRLQYRQNASQNTLEHEQNPTLDNQNDTEHEQNPIPQNQNAREHDQNKKEHEAPFIYPRSGQNANISTSSEPVRHVPANSGTAIISKEDITSEDMKFLKAVKGNGGLTTRKLYRELDFSNDKANRIRIHLQNLKLIQPVIIQAGKTRKKLWQLTPTAKQLFPEELTGQNGRAGGKEHQYWVSQVKKRLEDKGFKVYPEQDTVDLVAVKDGKATAIEVETGKSDHVSNARTALNSGRYHKIIIVATIKDSYRKILQDLRKEGIDIGTARTTKKRVILTRATTFQ